MKSGNMKSKSKSGNMKSGDIKSCNEDCNIITNDIKICDIKICDMPFDESDITAYNPLHNKLSIKPEKKVKQYLERLTYNKFSFIDDTGVTRTCFKKFITLVDYVKYLIGKYKPDEMEQLPSADDTDKTNLFKEYINSEHNYAYVDGLFYYLTSKLLKEGFVHGLEFYDNYVCLTKNCEINIADDFDYLSDSTFFNEKMNKLFHFKDESFGSMFKKNVQINISDENVEIVADTLDDLDVDENDEKNDDEKIDVEMETFSENSTEDEEENGSDHSTVDLSDTDPMENDQGETEWETEDE